jgi:aryl-alcohol dehydrogenase-like predicted oxidoreductase
MKYDKLGKSGLYVSKLCLGTGNFGTGKPTGDFGSFGNVAEPEAHKIMDFALDSGINFFDTANVYGGGPKNRGLSEEIIGRWFKQGGNRRERVVLGTKVGRIFENSDIDGPNNVDGLSLYKIRRHIEASLRRLQTEKVEMLQMHRLDISVDWSELWEAFEGVVRSGKVDYIGSSNSNAWEIVMAQYEAKQRNFMGLVNEQAMYNPLVRRPELELIPMAKKMGVGITLMSPLYRGLLGIDTFNMDKRPINNETESALKLFRPQIEEYSKLCHELGEEPANVTLAWELACPQITSVIIAPDTVDDLKNMLRAVEIKLDAEVMERIDDIFPPIPYITPYAPSEFLMKQSAFKNRR